MSTELKLLSLKLMSVIGTCWLLNGLLVFLIINDFPEFTGPVNTCKVGSIFSFSDDKFISLLRSKNFVDDEHTSDEHLLLPLCKNGEENGKFYLYNGKHLYGGKHTHSIVHFSRKKIEAVDNRQSRVEL